MKLWNEMMDLKSNWKPFSLAKSYKANLPYFNQKKAFQIDVEFIIASSKLMQSIIERFWLYWTLVIRIHM